MQRVLFLFKIVLDINNVCTLYYYRRLHFITLTQDNTIICQQHLGKCKLPRYAPIKATVLKKSERVTLPLEFKILQSIECTRVSFFSFQTMLAVT
uniref:Putative secreted peptide n=1 Tax=Anopheles braziliensis TaxID=58242 RepID=A0A2M3ZTB2_9DIPT